MRITLSTRGGQLPMFKQSRSIDIDTDADPAAKKQVESLVTAARNQQPTEEVKPAPDGGGYTIKIEGAGEPTVLRGSDANMTPQFSELLEWVEQRLHGTGK